MPPKKQAKKSDKKKPQADAPEDETVKLKEELRKAHMRIETLERYLVLRTEQAQRAKVDQEETKEKLKQLDEDFEKEKLERYNIASDMIRQYKAMQDDLIARINDLENKRAYLKDKLALSQLALEETKKEKDQVIENKEKEIAEQKQKMEEMVNEFGEMLKETLNSMGRTIRDTDKDDLVEQLKIK